MRTNPVKEKLRRGKPSFGTWLALGDLYATRVIARLGFDWLTLDIEHSAIDWSQATSIFGAIADAGCVPLARVPEGTHHYIKRVLDAGAWGIVVSLLRCHAKAVLTSVLRSSTQITSMVFAIFSSDSSVRLNSSSD